MPSSVYRAPASESERSEAIANLSHTADLAAALGARSVRLSAGAPVPNSEWHNAVERLSNSIGRIAVHAARYDLTLNIENHDGTMADTATQTHEIWGPVDEGMSELSAIPQT